MPALHRLINVYRANAPTNVTPHYLPMLQLALGGQTTDVIVMSLGIKHSEQSGYRLWPYTENLN